MRKSVLNFHELDFFSAGIGENLRPFQGFFIVEKRNQVKSFWAVDEGIDKSIARIIFFRYVGEKNKPQTRRINT
jgi:hypothetical protein